MNSPKGVKSCVPERVNISWPTCDTRHDSLQLNQSCVTVGEQTVQHMWHRSVKFVNKFCMTAIEFPKSNLKFPWRISLLQWLWNQNRSSEQKIFIFRTSARITYQLWNKNIIVGIYISGANHCNCGSRQPGRGGGGIRMWKVAIRGSWYITPDIGLFVTT